MSHRVPLTCYPGMNRFVLDWLGGDERFLPRLPGYPVTRLHSGDEPPGNRATGQPGNLRSALLESNKHWGIFPTIHEDAINIVAGQQVGFAGGPLYTLAKLASLIALKRKL